MKTDIHALVGAYVLDAVDDLERVAFDRHLAGCESCRAEVIELRETASRLADGAWSVPSPRLRTDVMAAIGRTRQLPPDGSRRSDRHAGTSRWVRYTAAAAAAVVLAGGAGAAAWTVQDQRVQHQRALAAAAEQREERTRAILAAPDLVVRTAPMIGGGKVTVASSALQDAAVVSLGADAPPAGGRVFQLWTIRGTTPASAGVLAAGQKSAVRIVDGLPGSDAFGVTVEPAGGSAAPTLPLVATVQLA
jgi:anti-sigma-K factor RskA